MKLSKESINGFSIKEFFCLVCCPPWPSRITEKIAFRPPDPTYSFVNETPGKCSITFLESDICITQKERKKKTECFYATTSRGNKIACVFVKYNVKARYTILFSHGNASDLGLMFPIYIDLSQRICCNIFGYDYSGYGASGGRPSEKNMYADIECAWDVLTKKLDIRPERIILYGQSLGTVPTVDLAARRNVGAVVLHSPLTSALRVVYPGMKRSWCCDSFLSIDKAHNITSPVLVIHGYHDETVPFSHGVAMFERCPRRVDPLWVFGAGHNTVECHSEYFERLKRFIFIELDTITKSEEKKPY